MAEKSETLTEACAPVFLYLTTFRRNSGTSTLSVDALHTALQREIERVRRRCDEDRKLRPLFDRAFYALVAAADQVVLSSAWPQRAAWSMKLLEMHYFKTSEGGKKFFRYVEEVLNDPSEEAVELAELLFTCLALGFQGELMGEPRELERRRRQLYEKARLPGRMGETISPEAYGRDATRKISKLPTVGILRLVVVTLAAIVFALVVGNGVTKMVNDDVVNKIDRQIDDLEEPGD